MPIAGHSNGSERLECHSMRLFPPGGSGCSASCWEWHSTHRYSRHHRLVLSLGHLVFAQVKSLGQGNVMLGFIRTPTRFGGRTAHGEGARFDPEHVELDRCVQIHAVFAGELETDTEANVAADAGGVGCCAELNAGPYQRRPRNHPVRPASSPMPVQWDSPPDCRWGKPLGTSPRSIPRHFRAYQKSPKGWRRIGPHLGFDSVRCSSNSRCLL